MWWGFDWGKYSEEIGNKQLTLRSSMYGIAQMTKYRFKMSFSGNGDEERMKEMKEKNSTYRWACRVFTFSWGFSSCSLCSGKA